MSIIHKSQTTVYALDREYYTNHDIFEKEKTAIFANNWIYACHISALQERGSFVSFSICNQELFAIRDKDNKIRVFYNVCAHRAHPLVSGNGKKRSLVCPYHAWTYNLDGTLLRFPNEENVPSIDKSKICLTEVASQDFCGFLLVNLSGTAKDPNELYPHAKQQLRSYVPQIDRLKPMRWVELEEACNWKVSVENYNECYHCSLNHPTFANGVIKPSTYNIMPYGYCLRHTTVSANLESMSYPIDPNDNEHATDYSSWFLWPNISFQVYPGNILNTYHWTPLDVDRVLIRRGWFTIDGEYSEVVDKLAEQDLQTTVAEDIVLVENVQKGLMNDGYKYAGPLVLDPNFGLKSEHSIYSLQKWTRQAID